MILALQKETCFIIVSRVLADEDFRLFAVHGFLDLFGLCKSICEALSVSVVVKSCSQRSVVIIILRHPPYKSLTTEDISVIQSGQIFETCDKFHCATGLMIAHVVEDTKTAHRYTKNC